MDKKLISLRDKRRERRIQSRKPPRRPGELDDVLVYWQRMIRNPLQMAGRQYWTERMLWGNALLAGLLQAVGLTVWQGIHPLIFITTVVNTLFLFFLVYYVMTYVISWILERTGQRIVNLDSLRTGLIVLSGWLLVLELLPLIPVPYLYGAGILGFSLLVLRSVHYATRASWSRIVLATAGGEVLIAVIMMLLAHL